MRATTAENPLRLVASEFSPLPLRIVLSPTARAVILADSGRTTEMAIGELATVTLAPGEGLTVTPHDAWVKSAFLYINVLTTDAAQVSRPPEAEPVPQYEQSLSLGGAVVTTRVDHQPATQQGPGGQRPGLRTSSTTGRLNRMRGFGRRWGR